MVLLSILIPVYNAGKQLRRCLDSIIKQVEFDSRIEVVMINDGSTDNSCSIIEEYVSQHTNIRFFSRENKGVGPTRNELLEHVSGKYFWFVDADDYVERHSLNIILEIINKDVIDMLLMSYYWVSGDNCRIVLYKGEFPSGFDLANSGIYQNSLWVRVIRTAVVKKHCLTFRPYVMGEDFDFLFKMLPFLGRVVCLEKPLYYYVFNDNSAVGRSDLEHKYRVAEDSAKCIEENSHYLSSFSRMEQCSLKKTMNLFVLGFVYSLYVDHFPIREKKDYFKRLEKCKALPIRPYPITTKQKIFAFVVSYKLLRNISMWLIGHKSN